MIVGIFTQCYWVKPQLHLPEKVNKDHLWVINGQTCMRHAGGQYDMPRLKTAQGTRRVKVFMYIFSTGMLSIANTYTRHRISNR